MLILEHSNNKALQNFQGLCRVMVWLNTRSLDQRVASIEELAHISAIVLLEHKLASWMHFFIAI